MKQVLAVLAVLLVGSGFELRAQDPATEERLRRLSAYVEDLLEDKARQQKQIADLTREVESLRDQVSRPTGNFASREEVAELARKIQEVDRNRVEDDKKIVKQIEDLGKALLKAPPGGSRPTPPPDTSRAGGSAGEKGYEYEVQPGDTLSVIVAAYRERGVKVSVDQILKANPGLVPERMKVGQKIFIPASGK